MIPLCNLQRQYKSLRKQIISKIDELSKKSAYIGGDYTSSFESDFLKKNKAQYGTGCASGTSALFIALKSLGIGSNDEVIVPSHTFVATVEAIIHTGATPVFVDINHEDYTIDSKLIKKVISRRTKAIIPVHIYGTMCEMETISSIAKQYNLKLIEDSAQSHFASFQGTFSGTIGDAGTFSFYPGKNMGAHGDGGFMIFKNKTDLEIATRLTNHGKLKKFDHELVGYTDRLDAIQAAILSIKLKKIFGWSSRRRKLAKIYDDHLSKNFKVIKPSPKCTPVYHLYVVEVSNRDEVMKSLMREDIQTGIHYPDPVHLLKPYKKLNKNALPITEKIRNRILSLPLCPELKEKKKKKVIDSFLKIAKP